MHSSINNPGKLEYKDINLENKFRVIKLHWFLNFVYIQKFFKLFNLVIKFLYCNVFLLHKCFLLLFLFVI